MKRFAALFLAFILAATSLCGCGDDQLLADAFIDPINEWIQYDELIAEIKAETDSAKRTELMHMAEDILMSTGAILPLFYFNDIYMQKSYVEGIFKTVFMTKYFYNAKLTNGSDTLRAALFSEPESLDPALNTSYDGATLALNTFAGLYTYDENSKTIPSCATGYTVSEDGRTYTVTLKDNLKWSDGSPLTASDFVYSWKRAASEATGADYGYMFENFIGYPNNLSVTAINDTTLQFALVNPCAYIEDLMAFPCFLPVKQSAVEALPDWQDNPGGWCAEAGFVSNGAFVCTGWDHEKSMTYEKNPYYFDADKVSIEKLELLLSDDAAAVYAAYQNGELDFSDLIPVDEISNVLNNPEAHFIDSIGTNYSLFNVKSDLFSGKTAEQAAYMRLAVNLLIDRKYICENIGKIGQVEANSFIPIGMADGNGGIFKKDQKDNGYFDPYAINNDKEATLKKARTYLEAAGYKFDKDGKLSADTPLSIRYTINTNGAGNNDIALRLKEDLAVLGISLEIIPVETSGELFGITASGDFDIIRSGWVADYNDPINMLELFTTGSGQNNCLFGK